MDNRFAFAQKNVMCLAGMTATEGGQIVTSPGRGGVLESHPHVHCHDALNVNA